MSKEGARDMFVGAFYEAVSPAVKQIHSSVEAIRDDRAGGTPVGHISTPRPRLTTGSPASFLPPPPLPPQQQPNSFPLPVSVGEKSRPCTGSNINRDGVHGSGSVETQEPTLERTVNARAERVLEDIVDLASFCQRVDAVSDLEAALAKVPGGHSDLLMSADARKAVGPRVAEAVYLFAIEESFRPAGNRALASRFLPLQETLLTLLGLSRAKVIDVHRSLGSKVYAEYVMGALDRKWVLDEEDTSFLHTIEETLGMTPIVCEEVVYRGKKTFLRRMVEDRGDKAWDDPAHARVLRECAMGLSISLRDDLALPEERRRRMFYAESKAVLHGEIESSEAKVAVEMICNTLDLPEEAMYNLYAELNNKNAMPGESATKGVPPKEEQVPTPPRAGASVAQQNGVTDGAGRPPGTRYGIVEGGVGPTKTEMSSEQPLKLGRSSWVIPRADSESMHNGSGLTVGEACALAEQQQGKLVEGVIGSATADPALAME
ncbi:unnamed protein product [Choristocarpus tenellus]